MPVDGVGVVLAVADTPRAALSVAVKLVRVVRKELFAAFIDASRVVASCCIAAFVASGVRADSNVVRADLIAVLSLAITVAPLVVVQSAAAVVKAASTVDW